MGGQRMDDRKQITYRLVTAVLESGKSHRRIAEEAGVSLNTMHYYMNKGGMPGADKLAALCRALNVSADWLLGAGESGALNGSGT
ncbi:XRE family transcriptional regulator [Neglecta sp. X4]|jgi:transcriptional regulator with XRE-family HTH domain|nr:XRE family transcriptional regulator [Neglectibacter sp. 59]NBJ74928.1 XRE family transcriptional regulator [Neglectibacter sp. X4]NCE82743.1 XRE family transcriptional regulator [Neglectibacter sp. X58]